MSVINNLEKIKRLMSFDSDDDFYFVQIYRRKKDNPTITGLETKSRHTIKSYYISSIEHLDRKFPEMVALAELFNARVYFNPNKRSYKRCSLESLSKLAQGIANGQYTPLEGLYNSVCGSSHNDKQKKWVVDIDDGLEEKNGTICAYIILTGGEIYERIPTSGGYHYITSPFNLKGFTDFINERINTVGDIKELPDIHKNNPTLLYYKQND